MGTRSDSCKFVSCYSQYIQVNSLNYSLFFNLYKNKENQKYPIIVIFTVCLIVTFADNWKNLRTQWCSSKAVNGLKLTFSHGKLYAMFGKFNFFFQ